MRIELPPSPRILVVVLQRLGDVLLTTPLIRSLKRAWPEARIDALVFAETAGILSGNPDIDNVVTMPGRPGNAQSIRLAARLWNRYDLAVSSQAGDRPTFFAYAAGRVRVAPVEDRLSGRLKKMTLRRFVPVDWQGHRVSQILRLAEAIGIAPIAEVVTPQPVTPPDLPADPYAVVHAAPMFRYKQWTAEGWRALAAALAGRGLRVIATGGPSEGERGYLDAIWAGTAVLRFDGRLDWRQLTGLLAGAKVYAGPDTSVTHLAAAAGCPTVALYGPTDPDLWGPWPSGGLPSPWVRSGTIQRRGNVWLVQQPLPCMPCQLEGCERALASYSHCLDTLPLERVVAAVDMALGLP
jgi:heptosyltransferase-3